MKCSVCGREIAEGSNTCVHCSECVEKTEQSTKQMRTKPIIMCIVILMVIGILVLVFTANSSVKKFITYVEQGEYTEARSCFFGFDLEEKQAAREWCVNYCEETLKAYNNSEIVFEDTSKKIEAIEDIIDVDKFSIELSQLKASKSAFEFAQKFFANHEWEKANANYEKVIPADTNYEKAIDNNKKCIQEISLLSFQEAQQLEAEEKWIEAIDAYAKVSEQTAEEYQKAVERKQICEENYKTSIIEQLNALLASSQYEKGLEIIEKTKKYLPNDADIKSYKENFTARKQEADLIKERNKYNTGITYEQLARDPQNYEDKYVKFYGKVLQVQTSSGITVYRIGTAGRYYTDNVVYAIQADANTKNRVLEDDFITIRGKSRGLHTYETVMGSSITIPSVVIDYIDR